MNVLAIPYAPRIRQIYWCGFSKSEFPNEFGFDGKRRPVAVISKKNGRHGTVEQTKPELSVKLKSPLDGKDTWAVCCHPATVSTHRLVPDRKRGMAHAPNDYFQRIKEKVLENLPD